MSEHPASARKGAKSIKEIPAAVLHALNKGEIETANLVEWLAIDQLELARNVFSDGGMTATFDEVRQRVSGLEKQSVNTISAAIGATLAEALRHSHQERTAHFAHHRSDMVRCWMAYRIGALQDLDVRERLEEIKPFATDPHFGVREVAWMSLRPHIAEALTDALDYLTSYAESEDENMRRFASEAIRPRGVWCKHIQALKDQPELALPLLERLKSDPSKYVQDSVGNWLNDAAKSRPEFVKECCSRWLDESTTTQTRYIVKRAMRSL